MKLLSQITMAIVLMPLHVQGQQNLVQNSSFELFDHCPNQSGIYSINALDWINPNLASADYYNVCALPNIFPPDTHQWPNMGVPANVFGNQPAHSGQAYIGMYCFSLIENELRDYVQVQLTDSIVASIRYQVSFYASVADNGRYAINTLGAYLSKEALASDNPNRFDVVPQILNKPENPLTNPDTWVLITDTFSSRYGGEKYLTIGNFNTSATSDTILYNPDGDVSYVYAYYYIDDVSVVALDSIPSGVGEVEQNQGTYHIYPNPSNGAFTIAHALHNNQMAYVEVYDLLGQRILTQQWSGSAPIAVDLSGVSSGLYTVRILVDNELKFSEKVSVIQP